MLQSDDRPDKRRFRFRPAWSAMLLLCAASSAWAIPSPDLVIGLSASVAQVLGLVSVLFTGFAVSGRGAAGRMAVEKRSTRSRVWRWVFRFFIVLLVVSIGANLLQHTSTIDEKNRRLQTNLIRSSMEAGKSVGDTSLKTLKLSDQIGHPLGIENTQLAKWIEEGRPLNLIDVREPEEVAMGRIEGSWHRRYPDLRENHANLNKNGKQTVLLCYSGNRSSELCNEFSNEFSKEGKACNFVVGGYEKWLADGYPLEFSRAESAEEIRNLPDYPNRDVLLDTPEVQDLVKERDIQFVDVRYPADFALDHLPGAVNIPVRKLPSSELIEQLSTLLSKPVIAPCYDKCSCFYGKILGSRLSEMGYEYLGRYSVPHEFFLPASGETPETMTVLGMVSAPMTAGLQWLTESTGRFSVAILLLVIVLRLITLPLTWKSERDRMIQRALAPEIENLKKRITDDAPRLSKATVRLYRRKNLTPVRNLIGSIAQLILFLVFFTVVNTSAGHWDAPFLWLPNASSEDPSYLLPAMVTLLFVAYMVFTGAKRSGMFLLMYAAGGGLIWMLAHQLNAPFVNPVFGALYVNRHEERSRLRRPPGPMSAFWLARNGENIESDFRDGFLPGFLNEMRLQEALDFDRLSTEQLIGLHRDWALNFIRETYVQAEVINVATEFYWKTACAKLERKGIDPAQYLGQIPATVVQRAMSLLTRRENREEAIREFLDLFGHRAPQDYELSQPRYRENPQLVIKQMASAPASGSHGSAVASMPADPVLRLAVDRARRFQVLKEEAKHQCLRQLALIRKLLLALDRRLELYEGIFYLTLDELLDMQETPLTETLRLQINARRDEAEVWRNLHLPSELSVVDLEGLTMAGGVQDSGEQSAGAMIGKRVAGKGDVVGKVHVIHSAEEIAHFKKGDIVVARFTDPTWYPLFPIAGGIITEVGGWLSHAAIVAREQNLTAIVGVKAASTKLETGQLVKLCTDGTIEVLAEKRASDSPLRAPKRVDTIESLELGGKAVELDTVVARAASGGGAD